MCRGLLRVDAWSAEGCSTLRVDWLRFEQAPAKPLPGAIRFSTARGTVLIVTPQVFGDRHGVTPPSLAGGPIFAGYTIGIRDAGFIEALGLRKVGERWVVPPEQAFGTAIAFASLKRQEQAHE